MVKHLSMTEPIATQIAAAFTRWRCKSRVQRYPDVPRVASNGDGKALNGDGKPVKGDEEALNFTEEALKGDGKALKDEEKI